MSALMSVANATVLFVLNGQLNVVLFVDGLRIGTATNYSLQHVFLLALLCLAP